MLIGSFMYILENKKARLQIALPLMKDIFSVS